MTITFPRGRWVNRDWGVTVLFVLLKIRMEQQQIFGKFPNLEFIIDGLVQDCSNSIANALELLQSCTKPSI